MHELSIATALAERVAEHLPDGARLLAVKVRAGALRGIDPEAMDWAWRSATEGSPLTGSALRLAIDPWRLRCDACGRDWTADDADQPCTCGNDRPHVEGGDELQLLAIEVE